MPAPAKVERPAEPLRIEEPEYVIVTPEMIAAGLERLTEFQFGEDLAYVVQAVYSAMEYERRRKS